MDRWIDGYMDIEDYILTEKNCERNQYKSK